MKTPIFKKNDFSVCKVPVPKGYPQSQTHCGVSQYGNKLLLVSSPYPSVKHSKAYLYLRAALYRITFRKFFGNRRSEAYENPCLYISDTNIDDQPVSFSLTQSRPLMEPLDDIFGFPAYNSDPDIFIENEDIFIINRSYFRTSNEKLKQIIRLYLINGHIENSKFKLLSINLFKETEDHFVSPCFVKYRDNYMLLIIKSDCYNDGTSFNGIYYQQSSSIFSLQQETRWHELQVKINDFIPWHMSLFSYQDNLYSIVACVKKGEPGKCYQMLGVLDFDSNTIKIYETPLTDISSYRGSAYVDAEGTFHLYSTTVNEKSFGGKSVDGREIITASLPFSELIKKVIKQ